MESGQRRKFRTDARRNLDGQLRPLRERLTKDALLKRAAKTEVRAIISNQLALTTGVANACANVLRRGIWGRVKWLLIGR